MRIYAWYTVGLAVWYTRVWVFTSYRVNKTSTLSTIRVTLDRLRSSL